MHTNFVIINLVIITSSTSQSLLCNSPSNLTVQFSNLRTYVPVKHCFTQRRRDNSKLDYPQEARREVPIHPYKRTTAGKRSSPCGLFRGTRGNHSFQADRFLCLAHLMHLR
uniref:Secreted protein n=1 Tax=Mesocestoides corti TaxID=53468 RepID=A0A5K3G2Y6_MESCO